MDNKNDCTDPVDQIRQLIDEGAPGVLSAIADLVCGVPDQPRPDDFAKIVRASCGRQVLFYKDANSGGNVLHAVVDFGRHGQADTKYDGFEEADFNVILDRCDVELADDILRQTKVFYAGAK